MIGRKQTGGKHFLNLKYSSVCHGAPTVYRFSFQFKRMQLISLTNSSSLDEGNQQNQPGHSHVECNPAYTWTVYSIRA